MRLKKLAFLVVILFAANATAKADMVVRIIFTGACDFVYQSNPAGPGKLVTMYMPPYEQKYGKPGKDIDIDQHTPFIRFAAGGAFILPDKATLSIDGAPVGVVTPTQSFESGVHKMTDKTSKARRDQSISFPLPAGGALKAQGGYEKWAFLKYNEPIPSNPSTESLASTVVFEYKVQSNSPIVLRVESKGGTAKNEFRIPFQNGVASVMIGNLPPDDIFFDGSYTPICADTHYLLHQKLRDKSTEDADLVTIPKWVDCGATQPPASGPGPSPTPVGQPMQHGKKDLYGPRDDCFMGWWPE